MNAKDEPRKAGTFAPVMAIYSRVPVPAVNSAVDGLRPVSRGTSIVAPNMANTCWKLRGIHRSSDGLSWIPMIGFSCDADIANSLYDPNFLTLSKIASPLQTPENAVMPLPCYPGRLTLTEALKSTILYRRR
jgi:hypothetical protein